MKIYALALSALIVLTACGGGSDSNTEVTPTNIAPQVSLASSQISVDVGETFELVATASDSDGRVVSYSWSQTSGPDITMPDSNTPKLKLVAPEVEQEQSLTFRVEVKDDDNASAWSEVSVTVSAINQKPQVSIISSATTVVAGQAFELEASATDSDGTIASYAWSQLAGSSVTIADNSLAKLNLVAPNVEQAQTLRFQVKVTDDDGEIATAEIELEVTVTSQQAAPDVYFYSPNINVITGEAVDVKAEAYDPDGQIVSYQWQQLSGPDLVIADAQSANLQLSVPALAIHQQAEFRVTVVDNDGLTASADLKLSLFPRFNSKTLSGRTDGKGVDLVIVADGFQQHELAALNTAALEFARHFVQEPTIAVHKEAWNIHLIESISQESGASFPQDNIHLNTAFDAHFQCGGIYRLLCVNSEKVMDVTAKILPQFDQIIVVVNSTTYGGSGGPVSVYSLADSASDIAIHELGHSFAGLADEYSYGSSDNSIHEPNQPNVTTQTEPNQLKWKHWITDLDDLPSQAGEQGVGLFEGAYYRAKNYYRPTDDSVMRNIGRPFGEVNAEQWSLNVHRVAGSVHTVAPELEQVEQAAGTSVTFRVEPVFNEQISEIFWYLDDQLQQTGTRFDTSFTVNTAPSSQYQVKVVVKDKTGLIRQDGFNLSEFENVWKVKAL